MPPYLSRVSGCVSMWASRSSLELQVLKQMGHGSSSSSAPGSAAESSAPASSVTWTQSRVVGSLKSAGAERQEERGSYLLGGRLVSGVVLQALAPLHGGTAALVGRRGAAEGHQAAGRVFVMDLHVPEGERRSKVVTFIRKELQKELWENMVGGASRVHRKWAEPADCD